MKKIIVLLTLLLNSSAFAASAVYFSSNKKTAFNAYNKSSEQLAIKRAKEACEIETNDCKLLFSTAFNGYGAIATSKNLGTIASTNHLSLKNAKNAALTQCNEKFGNCKILSSFNDIASNPLPTTSTNSQLPQENCYGIGGVFRDCNSLYDAGGRNIYTGKYINQP
jgi:Domain of unknown function (DUF4189)